MKSISNAATVTFPPTGTSIQQARSVVRSAALSRELSQKMRSLQESAAMPLNDLLGKLRTTSAGLSKIEADLRRVELGPNEVAHERPPAWFVQLARAFWNPFILVLVGLALVQLWSTPRELKGPVIIAAMIFLSVGIRFIQEYRSGRAAERLRALVNITATALRRAGPSEPSARVEVKLEDIVPGDVVGLSAGDMVPADVRLISSKDLFVSQAVLTGESLPVEKMAASGLSRGPDGEATEIPNLCLMGTNVVSGTATAVVVSTGPSTVFGTLSRGILGQRPKTNFDLGVSRVTWLMIRFVSVMAPVVLVLNGFTKGDWKDAALFAISVAVGLIPEMLPLVTTANLARGALAMSRQKVVVKRLNAIQSFGAMDILCTDKTGTLTQDQVVLEQHVDVIGRESPEVLRLAFLNSHHQTGLRNLLDRAVLDREGKLQGAWALKLTQKVDEVPFDFMRRRMSVVVEKRGGTGHLLICKGAVEEVMKVCTRVQIGDEIGPITELIRKHVVRITTEMNSEGMRVVAVAFRDFPASRRTYSVDDECELTLAGYIGFLDPPRESARGALQALAEHGVTVKILTGDSELVARKLCRDVGLSNDPAILLGRELEKMDEDQLATAVERTVIFAKLNPFQKARVVRVLKGSGHTVGFIGDGINDAAALRDADIGISVDTAVDVAKESADVILLEKSLLVLERGIVEGRTTFGNIVKYIKMTASSNFGNALSVIVASAFLPFLPMLPVQLLIQNLLYDISQLSIPWDRMDPEFLQRPRGWSTKGLGSFILWIGPISSVFDILTFLLLWYVFKANSPAHQSVFQSAWFIEGLLSQTLIVHMIRTRRIPFLQSRASPAVLWLTGTIMAIGVIIPFSPLGAAVGLVPPPASFFPWLVGILLAYCALTQLAKHLYLRRYAVWL